MVDESAEWRLLGALVDNPQIVLKIKADLFTGERKQIFSAMKRSYTEYGEISTEGTERFYGRPLPTQIEISRGAKPSAIIDRLADLATKRQLLIIGDSINAVVAQSSEVDRSELSKLLELPPLVVSEDSSLLGGVNGFISDFRKKKSGKYRFIDTGLVFLNYMMGGEWQRKALTLVMGEAGGGKTALVCNSMVNMAKLGTPSLFISIEMPKDKLISRMVANVAEIDGLKLRKGDVDDSMVGKIDEAIEQILNMPMYIVANPRCTIDQIAYEVKRHKEAYGIEVFFVDYLQIIQSDDDSEWKVLGKITQELRNLAVENDIAGVVLVQKNRSRMNTGLDSILGSSRIGQIADTVFEIKLQDSIDDDQRMCSFEFSKNREGPLGSSTAFYRPRYLRFE